MGFWASDRKTPSRKVPFLDDDILRCLLWVFPFYTLYPHSKRRAFQQKRRDPGRGPVDHPAGWAWPSVAGHLWPLVVTLRPPLPGMEQTVERLYCKRPILWLASSKILTPPPPGDCAPPAFGAGRGHTRWAERGVGGQYFGRRQAQLYTLRM